MFSSSLIADNKCCKPSRSHVASQYIRNAQHTGCSRINVPQLSKRKVCYTNTLSSLPPSLENVIADTAWKFQSRRCHSTLTNKVATNFKICTSVPSNLLGIGVPPLAFTAHLMAHHFQGCCLRLQHPNRLNGGAGALPCYSADSASLSLLQPPASSFVECELHGSSL